MPTVINSVDALQILDSRGNPTVEAEVTLSDGSFGRAAAPSGASTGSYEAHELRDRDDSRWRGKGVTRAVDHVKTELHDGLVGADLDQRAIDERLIEIDGTSDKSRLGANALLAVSLAAARAMAAHRQLPLYASLGGPQANRLPVPFMNILNGGAHADSGVDVQEFMIAPIGASTFSEALRIGVEIYHQLADELRSRNLSTGLGDEGGFAPTVASTDAAIEIILDAIATAGYQPGEDVGLALDVASTEYEDAGEYHLAGEGRTLDPAAHAEWIAELVENHPIISVEDPMAEEDWDGWRLLTKQIGDRCQIVGDDLLVTNAARLQRGIDEQSANAILIKPNQIGTLTETLDTITMALDAGWSAMMSHRSGETEDTTIAHLAVATGIGQIKTGAPARSDRVAKYNQLLRIERRLGTTAVFDASRIARR